MQEFVSDKTHHKMDDTNIYNLFPTMSKKKYKEFKKEYRDSGLKRYINSNSAVVEALDSAMDLISDAKLIVVTSRPYDDYRKIYSDTIYWMERIGLYPDVILFSKYAGTEVEIDGIEHLIIKADDMLCVMK